MSAPERFRYEITPRQTAVQTNEQFLETERRNYQDLPDSLLVESDYRKAKADYRRRVTLTVGDPVSDYYGYETAQKHIQAQDYAAERLGMHKLDDASYQEFVHGVLAEAIEVEAVND